VLIAGAKIGLGRSLTRLGQVSQAIALLKDAIAISSDALGADNPVTDTGRAALGLAFIASGEAQQAQTLLQTTQASIEKTYGPQAVITREVAAGLQHPQSGDAARRIK
jgi:hypothetical protein